MDLDTISIKELLISSPHYFIQKVFGYNVSGVHSKIIDHLLLPENNLTLIARGHGKSKMAQGVICWWICNNPELRVLLVSDTDRKATLFLSTIKQVIESSQVIKEFYGDLKTKNWSEHSITIAGRKNIQTEPSLMAIGAGSGAATGLHASKIVVDDLVSFDSARSELQRDRMFDWYRTTLMPVLISSGNFCCLGTRYHNRDIYDDLINSLHYNILLLPAINDVGESLCEWLQPLKDRLDKNNNVIQIGLETIREQLGSVIWELQYQNSTKLLNESHIIKYDYINYYDSIEWKDNQLYVNNKGSSIKINKIVLSVDPAISERDTADFTAITVGGKGVDNNIYILDYSNKHLSFNNQKEEIYKLNNKWSPNSVVVENVAFQAALIQELKRESGLNVIDIKPTRDKTARLMQVSGFFESGRVHFLKEQRILVDQLIMFPDAKNDDLVDAMVYTLNQMKEGSSGMIVLKM